MADRDDIARTLATPVDADEEARGGDGDRADADGVVHDDAERGPGERDIVRVHLTRAWQSFAPSPDLDARVRARLTGSTAATMGALGLGAATGAGRPNPWSSLRASGKVGVLVGAGLLGLGFLSGYFARSSPSVGTEPRAGAVSGVESGRSPSIAPPAAEGASPTAEVASPTTEVASTSVAPHWASEDAPEARGERHADPSRSRERTPRTVMPQDPLSRAATQGAATPSAASPSAVAPQPNGELALLRRAERAVRAGNAALALALIDEIEASYPRSTLVEERSAIELLAHCRAGAIDARARADRFLRQHPQSLYAGRARELCSGAGGEHAAAGALTKPAKGGHRSEQ